MMGLGVTQEDVSYIDKDKDKIMKALGNWKKQIVFKDKSREGHVDMLKVAMYNSYINRVQEHKKKGKRLIVKNANSVIWSNFNRESQGNSRAASPRVSSVIRQATRKSVVKKDHRRPSEKADEIPTPVPVIETQEESKDEPSQESAERPAS